MAADDPVVNAVSGGVLKVRVESEVHRLIMRGRLYSSCVRSSMLHGSETWPVSKDNVVALQRAEMRMVR